MCMCTYLSKCVYYDVSECVSVPMWLNVYVYLVYEMYYIVESYKCTLTKSRVMFFLNDGTDSKYISRYEYE